jgi:hypothetical protein
MSLETAQKVIVPQKKNYVPQFLKQRDINSYFYLPVDFYTQADTRRRGQETAQSFQRAAEQEYPSYPVTKFFVPGWGIKSTLVCSLADRYDNPMP